MTEEGSYAEATTEAPAEKGWLESYFADNPEVREKLGKFESPGALGKSYIELEKSMGSRVKIPGEGETEAWDKLYGQLGRPDTPDAYDFNPPEGIDYDPDYVSVVKTAAHRAGLNPTQVAALKEANDLYTKQQLQKQTESVEQLNNERWEKIKGDWGEDKTKENVELVRRYVDQHAPEELKELLGDKGVEADPFLVQLLAPAAKALSDDTLIRGDNGSGGKEEYKPAFPNSPAMYTNGEDEESKRARDWFTKRGHKY